MVSEIMKLLLAASSIIACAALETPDELHNKYYTIFPSGNRNAASHRWATYVLERSEEMTDATFRNLFSSFCSVSGSPVYASPAKRWKMTLPLVGKDESVTGMMYFCCAPCVCDTQEFIKVDTKTITTKDGPKQYHFTVIGNPCLRSEALSEQWQDAFSGQLTTLQQAAPDVKCSGYDLEKATLSDHGHIIIGMFFETDVSGHSTTDVGFNDSGEAKGYCKSRADNGYQSGMGEIFRKVALITPVSQVFGSANVVSQSSSVMWSETTTAATSSTSLLFTSTSSSSSSSIIDQSTASPSTTGAEEVRSSTSMASNDIDEVPSTTQSTTVSISNNFMETTANNLAGGMTSSGRQIAGFPTTFTCLFVAMVFARAAFAMVFWQEPWFLVF